MHQRQATVTSTVLAEAPNWDNSNEFSGFASCFGAAPWCGGVPGLFWRNEPNWDNSNAFSKFGCGFGAAPGARRRFRLKTHRDDRRASSQSIVMGPRAHLTRR
jgi:hypothetical protein